MLRLSARDGSADAFFLFGVLRGVKVLKSFKNSE